jgi:VanZ family protein
MRWAWRWAPVLAQMGAIFFASSMTAVPDLPGGLTDKTGHLIGYALLSALAIRAFAGATWSGVTTGAAVRAVLLSSAYGATDEFHQRFVTNRTPDVLDWCADTAGAILGVAIVLIAARMLKRPRA